MATPKKPKESIPTMAALRAMEVPAPPAPPVPTVPPQLAAVQGGGQRGAMPIAPDTGATPPQLEKVAGGAQHSFPAQTGADLRAQLQPPEAPAVAPATPAAAAPAKQIPDFSDALSRMATQKTYRPPAGEGKPKGEFWKKLGTVAKNTGRTVAELLQAAMFGWGGVNEPLQYQIRQAGERETAAKEADRAFEERMAQLNREWQAAQYQTRDANELAREQARLQAQAQQAQLDRTSSEKIAGLRAAGEGAIPGEDPVQAWLRKTFGGGK